MNVTTQALDFKDKHRLNYWVRVLCFAFSIVFIAMWLIPGDVEAGDASVFNVSDKNSYMAWNLDGAHTKDDYTVIPFQDIDDNLMLAYRLHGDSWSYIEIAPYDYFENIAGWKTCGAVVTSNNSVIVAATFSPSGQTTAALWISYGDKNFTDPWFYVVAGAGTGKNTMEIAINDTDQVCIIGRSSSQINIGIFDFESETMAIGMANWYSGTNNFASVCANKTGVFHIAYGVGASTTPSYVRDYGKVGAALQFTSGYQQYNVEIACLENDRLVVGWTYQFGANGYPYVSIQAGHESGFWQRRLSVISGQTWAYFPAISVKQNSSAFSVIATSYTNENTYTYHADWDASEATWQASETLEFNDVQINNPTGSFNQIWPRFNDTSFSQPVTGWVFIMYEDDPTPTDTLYLYSSSLNWTGDMTYIAPEPEPEPEPEPTQDGYGLEICRSEWIMFAVIFLIFFTLIGVYLNQAL